MDQNMSDDKCLRCGQCCFMPDEAGHMTTTPCRHLRFNEDGTTWCEIYEKRIGTRLSVNVVCGERRQDRFDYEGCPYNTGSKPIYRVDKKSVRRIFTTAVPENPS